MRLNLAAASSRLPNIMAAANGAKMMLKPFSAASRMVGSLTQAT
jgi:hypothetical protein